MNCNCLKDEKVGQQLEDIIAAVGDHGEMLKLIF